MVDDNKKVEDKEDDNGSSELDLSFKSNSKSNKINILGQSIDWATLISLGLGAIGTLGAGYLIYNEYNKNKAVDEQRKYQQWILQQQAAMMNQPQQQQSHIPPPDTGNDMVDMNSVNPDIQYDRFLDRGLPSGGSRLVQSDNSRPIPVAQPNIVEPQQEAVVDMDQYSNQPTTTMATVPTPRPVQRKSDDPTTEELMAQMYNNNNDAY